MAPSTLGTFLRAFTFGHVRQLDRVLDVTLGRAWQAGAGPGDGPLVIDLDSFIGEVYGYEKQGAAYGYTRTYGYHPIIATRSIPARSFTSATARARPTRSAAPSGSSMSCSPACAAPAMAA